MIWIQMHPQAHPDMLGLLPAFLDEGDERTAVEQFDANYCGGWMELDGATVDPVTRTLKFPGDPDLSPIFITMMRDELVLVYRNALVAVVQQDNSAQVSRLS